MTVRAWLLANRALVVLLSVCLILAAGLGTWVYISSRGVGPPKADGPTFFQALAEINQTLRQQNGGPWALFSVFGIAAQSPYSPNVRGYPAQNYTVNQCGAEFNGLTLWNGSIPVFNGSFESGTAPFWQFAFFSNTSQQILYATNVLGVSKAYPPVPYPPPAGSCDPWYDFSKSPGLWTELMTLHPVDSPTAVEAAWGAINSKWLKVSEPAVEIMSMGPGVFDAYGDAGLGWGVWFDRCGLVNVAGVQPLQQVGVSSRGQVSIAVNGTITCALQYSGHGASDGIYNLLFSAANVSTAPTTTQV
ncbi:MAG: hypothetical protein L3J97_05690, partial [Thermoplasmata archaeon]|nr:hypothetical protein [Thermoplasmata archaeon]